MTRCPARVTEEIATDVLETQVGRLDKNDLTSSAIKLGIDEIAVSLLDGYHIVSG
jgi:hypothetical protein